MQEINELLNEFTKEDIDWLFAEGVEQTIIAETQLVKEGEVPSAIWVVLLGLLGVKSSSAGDTRLAVLGPGELIGDMSYLEGSPASVSVLAVENSMVLALPKAKVDCRIAEDPAFAARFYKSLAILNSRRLRATSATLELKLQEREEIQSSVSNQWEAVAAELQEFKRLIQEADQAAIKNHGEVPTDRAADIQQRFRKFCGDMNQLIGDQSPEPAAVKEDLGRRIKIEVLPYLLQAETAERMYSKPRGYAGDYLTIAKMYQDRASGNGRIGPLLDRCFLNEPAARAVQNRRGLLTKEILRVVEESGTDAKPKILSIACGPAAEIFDTFETLGDPSRFFATLVDVDLQALAYVDNRIDELNLRRSIKPISGNLVYLSLGREKLDLEPQDLIYSIGLIDYFNDKFVIKFLNYIHGLLKPGGKVILGNFHPDNSTKTLMDRVLDWELIHRTEADMDRLYEQSKFGRKCTNVQFEEERVNLFAECVKKCLGEKAT